MKALIRKALACLLFSVLSIATHAQSSVSIGTDALKDNAVLWLKANGSQGLILPSLTTAQRNAISPNASDEKGMIVYDNQLDKVFYWNGSAWTEAGGGGSITTLTGDVTGAASATIVSGLKGKSLPATLPSSAQALTYNGSNWVFQPLSAGGTVSNVSATLPLSVTNPTTTPAISITQASAAANGYLSSADWSAFNNKLANPMTTAGDVIYGGASGAPTRLATATGFLKGGTTPSWASINLTSDVAGTLPLARGGTGLTASPTNGQLLIGNGAGYALSTITAGAGINVTNSAGGITINSTGLSNPMTANGDIIYGGATGAPTRLGTGTGFLKGGTTPSWASINLASDVAGTLPRASGGTGIATAPTNGQLLIGNGTGYALSTLTAGTGITVTNSAGGITINSTGLSNPMTANGDIIYGGATGAPTRLGTGTGFLKGGTTPSWASINLASDVAGTLPRASGGTGIATAPTNGQLLIGNGTGYALSTLTAGAGITVTNSAGGITINSTGLSNPMTAAGDLIYGGASGTPTSLATGTGFLKGGATPSWTSINLASDVTGTLPLTAGGTGATTAAAARTNLGLGSLATLSAPAFGAQNISTTGTLSSGAITTTNLASVNGVAYAWPASQGAGGTVLTNDGTGTLSWAAASTPLVTNNVIPKGNGAAQVASSLTDNGTTVSSASDFNLATGKVIKVNNSTVFSTIGSNNVFAGSGAAAANTGINNTFVGFIAGAANTSAGDNTFIGSNAGTAITTGNSNTFIGSGAGQTRATAFLSVFIGFKAGRTADLGGNVFVGASAGELSTGGLNNFIGENAGLNTTTGSQNTFVGRNTGVTNTTGSAIVLLGNESNVGAANLTNATAIGPSAIVNASNAMVLGSVGTSVGIGTTTPTSTVTLDVVSAKNGFVAEFDRNLATGSGIIGFYRQGGLVGDISESGGTISYNTFTGSHFATCPVALELGTLVTMTGKTEYMKGSSDPVYEVVPSYEPNDPRLLGSFLHNADDPITVNNKKIRTIMAVGNGIMWIADNGENIQTGDYLISSAIQGHAMKDRGQYEIAYIIARAAEPVQWENETASVDGVKHRKISVFYESFTRNYKAEKLEKEIADLQAQVNALKKDSAEQLDQVRSDLENLKKMLMAFSRN